MLLASIVVCVTYWLPTRTRRRPDAAASDAATAESAVLMRTLASAFMSSVVSGMDRRHAPRPARAAG